MSTRLYVGNLSFSTTEDRLKEIFAEHGAVENVDVIVDKFSGRSRGFGFVTMEANEAAEAAIRVLHGKNVDGRNLTVNVAKPREERPPRSDYGRSDYGRA